MTDDEMTIDRDIDAGTWDIDPAPVGPAGGARLSLSDDLQLVVDIAHPDRLSILVAEDLVTGQVRDTDIRLVALLTNGATASRIAGHDVGRTEPTEPHRSSVTRIALALDAHAMARSDWERDLWSAEIAGIAEAADDRLGLADLASHHRGAGSAGIRTAARRAGDLDREGLDALRSLSVALGTSDPLNAILEARPRAAVRRQMSLERIEVTRLTFESEPDTRTRAGWTMLDPQLASRRVFELIRPASLQWDLVDHLLRMRCALSAQAYLPEVEANWARVYRARSRTLLALCPLDAFRRDGEGAEAELFLGPVADDAWDSIRVDVTANPDLAPLSFEARQSELAAAFGRAAVAAQRLGLGDVSANAWQRSAATWRSVGDNDRSAGAAREKSRSDQGVTPFAAEIVITGFESDWY